LIALNKNKKQKQKQKNKTKTKIKPFDLLVYKNFTTKIEIKNPKI